jgi:hypothetical protein
MKQQTRERLATLAHSCVVELGKYFPPHNSHKGMAQGFIFESLQPRAIELLKPEELAVYRRSQPFSQLIAFVMSNSELVTAILGEGCDLSDLDDRAVFQSVVEISLFRGLVAVHHHSPVISTEKTMAFVDFLGMTEVERDVVVPLKHISLEEESYELDEFGVFGVDGKTAGDIEHKELFSQRHCFLKFKVRTGKYFAVTQFALAELIRTKMAAIRMAINPFASFNRFYISHIRPWEDPLQDEYFCDRFYGRGRRLTLQLDDDKVSRPSLEETRKLYQICRTEKWKRISPWRLALNRLDDSIFKIESGSEDALLDVVIGLESVLVEPQSAQESTHKVAVRAARFLESEPDARAQMFKAVKRLYALRSKIAHGKSLGIDTEAKELLKQGVRLLTKVLKKMLEADVTELDLAHFDLN